MLFTGIYPQFMENKCICTSLRQAAQSSTAYYDVMLAPSGLKVTMFRLLRRVSDTDNTTITDLAKTIGLDRSTLGRNLRVLERQGYVPLSVGKDERARAVTLTQTGLNALATALPLWDAAQTGLRQDIGTDLDQLLQTLERLADLRPPQQDEHP